MSDSAILAAWDRRTSAYLAIHADRNLSDEDAAPLWAETDAADAVINDTLATCLPELEVQIWTALHASDAYLPDDALPVLNRDLDYVARHKVDFDWKVQPLIMALQFLRAREA